MRRCGPTVSVAVMRSVPVVALGRLSDDDVDITAEDCQKGSIRGGALVIVPVGVGKRLVRGCRVPNRKGWSEG